MATLHQPQGKRTTKRKPLISDKKEKKQKAPILFSRWTTGDNLVKVTNDQQNFIQETVMRVLDTRSLWSHSIENTKSAGFTIDHCKL